MTRQPMKELQVIWGALMGGVVMYTAVAYCLITFGVVEINGFDARIMNVFGVIVIAWMLAAMWARRAMLARIPADASAEDRLARYQTTVIAALAFMEGGGLVMITVGMVVGAENWILAGGAAAAALMFMARPTADELGPR